MSPRSKYLLEGRRDQADHARELARIVIGMDSCPLQDELSGTLIRFVRSVIQCAPLGGDGLPLAAGLGDVVGDLRNFRFMAGLEAR